MAVTREDILNVLRTIRDPEMPISIVDLGIVEDVRIETSRDDSTVFDPEALFEPEPQSRRQTRRELVEVRKGAVNVDITVLPTFIGCPALDMIRDEIVEKVGALVQVDRVEVEFIHDPPWNVDRISEAGRESLRRHGVSAPDRNGVASLAILSTSAIACPFCGSSKTRLDSPFGPTRCRSIYYCDACRNSFEHMKRL